MNHDALQELKPGAIIRHTVGRDADRAYDPVCRVIYLGLSPHSSVRWGYLSVWWFTYWGCESPGSPISHK